MKMETNKMWQIFMLTILLTLAGCKNGGEYSQSVPEYATMQVAPVNKTLSTQYPAAIQGKQDIAKRIRYSYIKNFIHKLLW